LRDLHAQLLAAKVTVAGVSPKSPDSHAGFAAKHALPFTLLCDPEKTLARAYDVVGPLGFGVRRASFLISQSGMIEEAVLADLRIGRHEDFFRKVAATGL
jgi:peroxiredoxin Q/BCP